MRLLLTILLVLYTTNLAAADVKVTALTEDTAPTGDDLTVTVNDPGGTPATRKATLNNVLKLRTISTTSPLAGGGDLSADRTFSITAGGISATELGADSVSASELNATGVEAELEAVLDLVELQGQIGDAQIADGAVDGGTGGEITDASVTAADLADGSVADGELASTECFSLPVHSAKVSGAFVVQTIGGGDASTQGAAISGSDGSWKLLFDATTDEAAVWQFRLPAYWAAHDSVKIQYLMASATTLEVEYEVAVMCVSDGDAADVDTASFANVAVGSATVPGTAGHPDEISITVTDDSCAAADLFWLFLSTDANDATSDDATGDREVINVQYCFTR